MTKLIITGATQGIGLAIVQKFAAEGANIAFCARTKSDIAVLQLSLEEKYPTQSFFGAAVDMADARAVGSFAQSALDALGSSDILVNNAGIFIPGNVLDEPDGRLMGQLQVNLMSAYHLTRAIAPAMIRQGSGHIFNMCSVASLSAYPGGGAYSISKHALLGLSDNLRLELMPKGVKVTAIMPGATMSRSWEGAAVDPERIMEASDIAEMVYSSSMLSAQACVERIVLRPQLGDL